MLRDGDAIHAFKNDLKRHISYTSTALNLDLCVRASTCRSKSHDSTSPRHIIQPTDRICKQRGTGNHTPAFHPSPNESSPRIRRMNLHLTNNAHHLQHVYALPPATFFLPPLDLADLLLFSLVPCSKAVESTRSRPMSSSFLTAKIRTIQFSEVNSSSASGE